MAACAIGGGIEYAVVHLGTLEAGSRFVARLAVGDTIVNRVAGFADRGWTAAGVATGALAGDGHVGVKFGWYPGGKAAFVATVTACGGKPRHGLVRNVGGRLAAGLAAVVTGGTACRYHAAMLELGRRAPGVG